MMTPEQLDAIAEYWRVEHFRAVVRAISDDQQGTHAEMLRMAAVSGNQHAVSLEAGKLEAWRSLPHEFNQYVERNRQR
jgi:hypothetical protein